MLYCVVAVVLLCRCVVAAVFVFLNMCWCCCVLVWGLFLPFLAFWGLRDLLSRTKQVTSRHFDTTASLSNHDSQAFRLASVNASQSSRVKFRIRTSTRRFTSVAWTLRSSERPTRVRVLNNKRMMSLAPIRAMRMRRPYIDQFLRLRAMYVYVAHCCLLP